MVTAVAAIPAYAVGQGPRGHRYDGFCAHAGNAIATSGEDGQVKIWSRSGMLRSTIMEAEEPVYCLAWGGSAGSQLLVCSGSTVSVRSLLGVASGPVAGAGSGISGSRGTGNNSSSNMQVSWKAHDGVVLKADWNAITGLVVTGGEDCRYKV
jgi:intraflagellar transport protein 80